MNLAYPALTDAEHRANLLEVQFFLVVKAQHQLFPLRQVFNRLSEAPPEGIGGQPLKGIILRLCLFYRQLSGFIELVEAKKSTAVGTGN